MRWESLALLRTLDVLGDLLDLGFRHGLIIKWAAGEVWEGKAMMARRGRSTYPDYSNGRRQIRCIEPMRR